LPFGFALDSVLGDPRGWPHPVRLVGALIGRTEVGLRRTVLRSTRRGWVEVAAGVVLLAVVTGATGLAVWGVRVLAARFGAGALLAADSLLIYWGLAARSLALESLRASDEPDLARARVELAMIVGRDTATLDRPEVCRACVETVAENCNDAVVAPLFWFAVGGPVGMWVYKAINTLDSMVGYRNERYARVGRASARVDDLANLVPARLTWLLIALASVVTREDARKAFTIGWRDGRKHPSPNAAWGEAAMAGALGVRLGGLATYRGVPGEKPRLGDPGDPMGPETVRRAVRVMTTASALAAALAWAGRAWLLSRA
jgi:adenosylcobinamide-phosphate synthase